VLIMEHAEIRAEPLESADVLTLVRLGDGTQLSRFVTIWATVGVNVGDSVLVSDWVSLVDCWGYPSDPDRSTPAPAGSPIVIEEGASLGCGCVIGPGITVGQGAFIGEGSVVLHDVPAHSVVYGNPARVTRRWTAMDGWEGAMFGPPAP
jgi:acetyltransferase-like isoleucine patch superfamily enzyme